MGSYLDKILSLTPNWVKFSTKEARQQAKSDLNVAKRQRALVKSLTTQLNNKGLSDDDRAQITNLRNRVVAVRTKNVTDQKTAARLNFYSNVATVIGLAGMALFHLQPQTGDTVEFRGREYRQLSAVAFALQAIPAAARVSIVATTYLQNRFTTWFGSADEKKRAAAALRRTGMTHTAVYSSAVATAAMIIQPALPDWWQIGVLGWIASRIGNIS